MGANEALGYGARRDGLTGILAIAPGHVPDEWSDMFAGDLGKASKMITAGRKNEKMGSESIYCQVHDYIK